MEKMKAKRELTTKIKILEIGDPVKALSAVRSTIKADWRTGI
jgi:hypothetical protein